MLTFLSIPTDIRDLIYDHLSIPDLVSLYNASLQNRTLRQSCKHIAVRRLTHIITHSTFKIRALIDGERGIYKRHRYNRYERDDGALVAPRPFRPFDVFASQWQRTFSSNGTRPQMKISQICVRAPNDPPVKFVYDPHFVGNQSQGPEEIVTVFAVFSVEGMSTPTRLSIEYDTAECSISGSKDEDDGDEDYLRTISHPLAFRKGVWIVSTDTPLMGQDRQVGLWSNAFPAREDYELPKEWLEMLGHQVMAKAVFKKRRPEFTRPAWLPMDRQFTLQLFELVWDVELSESSCRPNVLDLWRDGE
jgi:hypothetical protein